MFRKYFFLTFLAISLSVSSAIVASAQVGELHGHVKLKQADGTMVPAVGAIIDVFRTDMTGKYEQKTDKRGEFRWAGLPLIGNYIIAVSMPNAQPTYADQVKVGRDLDVELIMAPGDGRRLTLEELKTVTKGGGGAGAGTKGGADSAEDKAKNDEITKKNADIEASNKRNTNINEIVGRTFKAGQTAITAKNYDEAIKQFDEGLAADPEQGILYTRKADAFRMRGVDRYNSAIQTKDAAAKQAGLDSAKDDFKQAAEVTAKAVELVKKEQPATEAATQATQAARKLATLQSRAESMRLFVSKVDPGQADAGLVAFGEYLAAETDPVKKAKGEHDAAQMLFDANAFDKALAAYQKILETNPDDVEALLKAGLCLFNIGALNTDKTKYQEAANYLQRYIDKAPDSATDTNKADAKAIIENLKEQENVKPEKVTAPPRRKRP